MHFNAYPELHKQLNTLVHFLYIGYRHMKNFPDVVADVISGLLTLNVNKIK